ncbi:hypothetical protein POM88_034257 [Heracleum sosnowskyi]|uniref:Uncharacterized protein n=1 Tax=Heracleum sosnowskyi TaxID=360622 RepID=A0AAD8HIX6_9APIA|nr:hypothetical protein POM88_034257 [Heracleum sosnowskyi]
MSLISGAENPWYKAIAVKQPVLLNFAALRPLAFFKSCKVVLLEVDNAKFMWYDPKRKTAKNVRIHGIPNSFYSYLYTESLLQLSEDKPLQKPSQDMRLMKQKEKSFINDMVGALILCAKPVVVRIAKPLLDKHSMRWRRERSRVRDLLEQKGVDLRDILMFLALFIAPFSHVCFGLVKPVHC